MSSNAPQVQRRRIPYPYKAMLAICSDLDETPDRQTYWEIMRFLNTTEMTSMGAGVCLEVGNSIYFDMPPGQFAYWNTDDDGRAMVRELIRSGHIDCLHSYGDLATTRRHAGRALDELDRHGLKLEVWVDHGTAVTNFGADIMRGHGDQPGHEAYHADLTLAHGVKYVWRGRVTSVIGQDVRRNLGGLFYPRHPLASAKTVAKEAVKGALGRLGCEKYRLHPGNRVLQPCGLRDGGGTMEFLRCSPHWGGVGSCETGRGIGHVVTDAMLSKLVQREGICVLYTHLGKVARDDRPFDASAVAAFRRLAESHRQGRVLVTTSRRLLHYVAVLHALTWSVTPCDSGIRLALSAPQGTSVQDLAGISFILPSSPNHCCVTLNGVEIPPDTVQMEKGRHTMEVTFRWRTLTFPTEVLQ